MSTIYPRVLTLTSFTILLSSYESRGSVDGRLHAPQAYSAKAMVTVGSDTFTFAGGRCQVSADMFSVAAGQLTAGEHFELNIPHPARTKDPSASKPTKDGTYTHASVTVIPAGGATSGKRR